MSAACKTFRLGWMLVCCASLGACALSAPKSGPATAPVPAAAVPVKSEKVAGTVAPVVPESSAPVPVTAPMSIKPAIPAAAQKQFDAALELLKSNRTSEAQQQLLQLTQSNPELVAPWINLGLIELKANHFEAALTYFKQAVQHDASSAVAQNYLGMSYRNIGQFKQAEGAYQAAIAANADYALAYFNLGVLYDLYLQQPDLALQQYEHYQALQGTPDSKVASWIKELKARLGSKAKAPETQS